MPNRRKLSLALTVMACSMTVAAQISSLPSSWDGQRWTDQYMGKTWNKTWQNGPGQPHQNLALISISVK